MYGVVDGMNPSKATGLVKRDVIRVMTPGTVIESNIDVYKRQALNL